MKAYEFFKENNESLKNEHDFLNRYAYEFMSWKGLEINSYLRGEKTKQDLENIFMENDSLEHLNQLLYDTDKFIGILRKNDLKKNNSFYTIQRINELDERHRVERRVVSDKGFDIASLGAEIEDLDEVYGVDDGWTVITYYDKDNKYGKGLVIGQYIEKYLNKNFDYFIDWECVFISPPMQRFERQIIDENNKVILQTPYPPIKRD